ncbi:VOC family protein [Rhodococcus tibetensis]|uniref:2-oxoadipate dioxygenase/decarboxylase n=1 Tax=Rhodococcus tibetensis TaxID=2965064 RepID=A0ABT1QDH9_9NOCA|nr:VOC family protein [Rhodococcus sp. FXJ9.536]MCQ4120329.1 VOC family protein [Rhodococcus sp. FXJ9.536]
MVETWELRARFARALSAMYGRELPAYTTLVEVTAEVNADLAEQNPAKAVRFGSLDRVAAERHGAIRLGSAAELRQVAILFAGFGMHPVGFYDLRDGASPVPLVATAFRPLDSIELGRNPFGVFTSMLTTADRRFFDADLQARLENFLTRRSLFPTELLHLAALAAEEGGLTAPSAERFVSLATTVFALSDAPIDKAWYSELEAVSPVAADIGVAGTHIDHLTPRVLDIDELYRRMTARGITMIDRIQGPPVWDGPDVLVRQTSFRAMAEPRRFILRDRSVVAGETRVRFGNAEARGIALTPAGRELYDRLAAADADAAEWEREFPRTEPELESRGMAYFTYRREGSRHIAEPIVYEDFLPASATDTCNRAEVAFGSDYHLPWLAETLGRPVHDPFALYQQQQDRSRERTPS